MLLMSDVLDLYQTRKSTELVTTFANPLVNGHRRLKWKVGYQESTYVVVEGNFRTGRLDGDNIKVYFTSF